MAPSRTARQTIPLWSLRLDGESGPEEAAGRGAKVIRLPPPRARLRGVLTYPAAIGIRPRPQQGLPDHPVPLIALLAVASPTALVGCGMLLLQFLA
ncbi:hypothetical protein [Falsiroseomonas sp.]|uniref:hypothetical protein n=1 Tax=Falsiroseomonas sp. TaxID=2870721 RepID=UPI003F71C77A